MSCSQFLIIQETKSIYLGHDPREKCKSPLSWEALHILQTMVIMTIYTD